MRVRYLSDFILMNYCSLRHFRVHQIQCNSTHKNYSAGCIEEHLHDGHRKNFFIIFISNKYDNDKLIRHVRLLCRAFNFTPFQLFSFDFLSSFLSHFIFIISHYSLKFSSLARFCLHHIGIMKMFRYIEHQTQSKIVKRELFFKMCIKSFLIGIIIETKCVVNGLGKDKGIASRVRFAKN